MWGRTSMPILAGAHVRLAPMKMERCDNLFDVTAPNTFEFFPGAPRAWTREAFRGFVSHLLAEESRWMFVVSLPGNGNNSDGERIIGSTSFMDMRPAHRGLEIGSTWYASEQRGTKVNPTCKLLMLEHAFVVLGCERVQLKCDGRNQQSTRAIIKLGACFEGTLRKHMIMPDGFVRDTAMFSVVRNEWPAVRERLLARVAE